MLAFEVKDMTCGHCAARIQKALLAADPQAKVEIDVPGKRVRVASAMPADEASRVIAAAGYTPAAI